MQMILQFQVVVDKKMIQMRIDIVHEETAVLAASLHFLRCLIQAAI